MTHKKNKRPSNKQKHQKGQARTKAEKENSLWKKYKREDGKSSKNTWKKNRG